MIRQSIKKEGSTAALRRNTGVRLATSRIYNDFSTCATTILGRRITRHWIDRCLKIVSALDLCVVVAEAPNVLLGWGAGVLPACSIFTVETDTSLAESRNQRSTCSNAMNT